MVLALPESEKIMPSWFSVFLTVVNTSKVFTVKRAVDEDTAKMIEIAYDNVVKNLTTKFVESKDLTTEDLVKMIGQAVYLSQLSSPYFKQSLFSKVVDGDKNKKMTKIINLVGKNLIDAARSMKRFEGVDETSFLKTKEIL